MMGYYTGFDISAEYIDGSRLTGEMVEKVDEAMENLDLSDFCNNGGGHYWAYDKWYDSTEDMLAISHDFPGVLFTVYGDGEESDDYWVEYFLDGRCQHEAGEVVYGEFDVTKLGLDGVYKCVDPTDGSAPDDAPAVGLDEILDL